MIKKTSVKCDVETCKHNDSKLCSLDKLDISCICPGCECHNQKETICRSFLKK